MRNEEESHPEIRILTISLPVINLNQLMDENLDEAGDLKWVIGLFLLVCAGIGYGVVAHQKKKSGLSDAHLASSKIKSNKNGILTEGVTLQFADELIIWVDGRILDLDGVDRHQQIAELLALVAQSPDHKMTHADLHQSL